MTVIWITGIVLALIPGWSGCKRAAFNVEVSNSINCQIFLLFVTHIHNDNNYTLRKIKDFI